MTRRSTQDGGPQGRVGYPSSGRQNYYSYKNAPASPVGVHPLANYQVIPAPHHVFAGRGGNGEGREGVPMPHLVYPYHAVHQPPLYAPPPEGAPHQGYYQHYVPMQMAVQMPVHQRGMSPEFFEEDFDRSSLVLSRLSLNPMADEYAPSPFPKQRGKGAPRGRNDEFGGRQQGQNQNQQRGGRPQARKRRSNRSKDKQLELQENIRKTVYISDLDQQITEEQLATFFADCGVVLDCRVCGDPNSALRFAFVEFATPEDAANGVKKTGCELGTSRVRVLPSKTAIVPVNKELMPKNKEEMELCSRTVYATNIDKKVDRDDVQRFFEALCGPVGKLRLLGDHAHSTRIAFVEFQHADSALAALSCSGALLGTMPIRVSPSKTPVRFSGKDSTE